MMREVSYSLCTFNFSYAIAIIFMLTRLTTYITIKQWCACRLFTDTPNVICLLLLPTLSRRKTLCYNIYIIFTILILACPPWPRAVALKLFSTQISKKNFFAQTRFQFLLLKTFSQFRKLTKKRSLRNYVPNFSQILNDFKQVSVEEQKKVIARFKD